MDSDMLILQNLDDLFWMPAPAATFDRVALLGDTDEPRLSAGVLVPLPLAASRRIK